MPTDVTPVPGFDLPAQPPDVGLDSTAVNAGLVNSMKPDAQGYTGRHPFASVAGPATGRINFQATGALVCANCHSTLNHIAPLFANFDENGIYRETIAVKTSLVGTPPLRPSRPCSARPGRSRQTTGRPS